MLSTSTAMVDTNPIRELVHQGLDYRCDELAVPRISKSYVDARKISYFDTVEPRGVLT